MLLFYDAPSGAIFRAGDPYGLPAFISLPEFTSHSLGCIIGSLNFKSTINVSLITPLTGIPYFYVLSNPPAVLELEGVVGIEAQDLWRVPRCTVPPGLKGIFLYSWNYSAMNLDKIFSIRIWNVYFKGFITDFTFTAGRDLGYLISFRLGAVVTYTGTD